jgi:hypothetical protein
MSSTPQGRKARRAQDDARRAQGVATTFVGIVTAAWLWPIVSFVVVTPMIGSTQQRIWTLGAAGLAVGLIAVVVSLPRGYFRLRSFEADGRLYARLGVRRFRAFVLDGDLMNRWVRRHAPGASPALSASTLRTWTVRSCVNERIHLAAFVSSIPVIVAAYFVHRTGLALYLSLLNVPFNVYPILLQRYTRGRLLQIVSGRYGEPPASVPA